MALGALVLIAIVLLLTGPHLVHLYDTTVANCSAEGDCSAATSALITDGDKVGVGLRVVVEVVPALIGLFWGAPLVAREALDRYLPFGLDSGHSHALDDCQDRPSRAGEHGYCRGPQPMVTWWSSPLDRWNMNIFGTFDQRESSLLATLLSPSHSVSPRVF